MRKFSEMVPKTGNRLKAGFVHPAPSAASAEMSSRPIKVPCGTIWPNGEFGLGYSYNKEQSDPFCPNQAGGVSLERMRDECEVVAGGAKPLDLTSPPNSHTRANRPESYGRKGLSGYGGKMVRNGGFCLQQDCRKDRLTFMTLTLPELTPEQAVKVSASWGDTMRQLIQWLTRQLEAAGLPKQVCAVTELQTSRLQAGSHTVLHVHAVFVGRLPGKTWAISVRDVRRWWLKRLSRVTSGTVESMSCVDMKRVERDAGNYLSKYMSKGSDSIAEYAEKVGWDAVPRQWWNMSKAMRRRVKSACLRSGAVMGLLDVMVEGYWAGCDDVSFKFIRSIEVRATELQSFVVGFWGKLNRPAVDDLTELAECLKLA